MKDARSPRLRKRADCRAYPRQELPRRWASELDGFGQPLRGPFPAFIPPAPPPVKALYWRYVE